MQSNWQRRFLAILTLCAVVAWPCAVLAEDAGSVGCQEPFSCKRKGEGLGEIKKKVPDTFSSEIETEWHESDGLPVVAEYEEEPAFIEQAACFDECGECLDCGPACGFGCGNGCPPSTWYRAGYLLWWSKATDLPVLATTSSDPNGTGALDDANTQLVFGGRSTNGAARGGGKFGFGKWLDNDHCSALEVEYLFLGEKEESFFGSQDTFTVLARPFFNVDAGIEDSRLIVSPGDVEGSLNIRATTDLHTSALLKRKLLSRSSGHRLDYLYGYRFAYLGDGVNITEATTALSGVAAGTTFDLLDSFQTHNQFHGAEIGFEYQSRVDHIWSCVVNAA